MQKSVPLSSFSSFGVGGCADFFVRIHTLNDLQEALDFAQSKSLPMFFLGGGSNVIFSDSGFHGVVFFFENKKIVLEKELIVAESGATNAEVFRFSKERGLDFSPFLTLPGTLGGATVGNAGTPIAEISDVLVGAELFDLQHQKIISVKNDFFDFGYRKSILQKDKNFIVWRVFLQLPGEGASAIEAKARQFVSERKEKQPWGKTSGSFFKNPKEHSAGFLLEKAGMKGEHFGGVFFSEKHANFLMNSGNGTQAEVLLFARQAQQKVFDQFGIRLENEVRIVDEWGKLLQISE